MSALSELQARQYLPKNILHSGGEFYVSKADYDGAIAIIKQLTAPPTEAEIEAITEFASNSVHTIPWRELKGRSRITANMERERVSAALTAFINLRNGADHD